MEKEKLIQLIPKTVDSLDLEALNKKLNKPIDSAAHYKGKVRDVVDLGDKILIFTSDRISAFDRVLARVPAKGEVLNTLSLDWFEKTKDIMANHVIKQLSPRAVLVKKCEIIPIEIIIRGYLTGSAWRDYQKGNAISGITLPAGMKNNQAFDAPLLTPTTKASEGHDMPISKEEILEQKIVSPELWAQIEEKAFAMFKTASEMTRSRGLILVDTKLEFGLIDGKLVCADEIFTPDSSRYWYLDSYQELFDKGEDQRKLDKEYLRKWLMDQNYMGDGEPPVIPEEVLAETATRYIEAFENITGTTFTASEMNAEEELEKIASELNQIS